MSADNARVKLNATVRALVKIDRPEAVAILARFDCTCTPELKAGDIEACTAAFADALAKVGGTP